MSHPAVAPEEFSSLGDSETQCAVPVSSYLPISKVDMNEEEGCPTLAGLFKTAGEPTRRWERNRLRKLDQIAPSIDLVLAAVKTCYQTPSNGSPSPVDSLLPEHPIETTYSKVIPTWVPTTQLEREHYSGKDGNITGCWAGIREANSISAWAHDRIERQRRKREVYQEENARATDPQPETYDESRPYNAIVRNDFTSNSLCINESIMPDYIVTYGPLESVIAPSTMLSREEIEREGGDTIVAGWSRESMDEAWSQFQPRLRRRHVEGYEALLRAPEREDLEGSGSGSERGSVRTVRRDSVRNGEPVDEDKYHNGDGSGSSNSSTGTVRHVGGAG